MMASKLPPPRTIVGGLPEERYPVVVIAEPVIRFGFGQERVRTENTESSFVTVGAEGGSQKQEHGLSLGGVQIADAHAISVEFRDARRKIGPVGTHWVAEGVQRLATLATSEGDEEGIGGTHGAASVGRRCSGAGSYGCGGCYHGARR